MQPRKHHILCVDDDPDTCAAVSILLGLSGYEVMAAHTAGDAVRLAQSERFDLYLLDERLPDRTGAELCRQIRALDPEAPILFCSGSVEEADRQAALSAGAQAYLIKPDSIDLLEPTIARLLSHGSTAGRAV